MSVFIGAMENYVFLERGRSHLSKNVQFSMGTIKTFIWLLLGFILKFTKRLEIKHSRWVGVLFPINMFS